MHLNFQILRIIHKNVERIGRHFALWPWRQLATQTNALIFYMIMVYNLNLLVYTAVCCNDMNDTVSGYLKNDKKNWKLNFKIYFVILWTKTSDNFPTAFCLIFFNNLFLVVFSYRIKYPILSWNFWNNI